MLHRRALLADMEATDPTLESDGPEVSDANWPDELRVSTASEWQGMFCPCDNDKNNAEPLAASSPHRPTFMIRICLKILILYTYWPMVPSLLHSTSSFKLQLFTFWFWWPLQSTIIAFIACFHLSIPHNIWRSPFGRTIKCFPFSCLFFSAGFILFLIPGALFATLLFQELYVHHQHQWK